MITAFSPTEESGCRKRKNREVGGMHRMHFTRIVPFQGITSLTVGVACVILVRGSNALKRGLGTVRSHVLLRPNQRNAFRFSVRHHVFCIFRARGLIGFPPSKLRRLKMKMDHRSEPGGSPRDKRRRVLLSESKRYISATAQG